jgi:hypothetical protein
MRSPRSNRRHFSAVHGLAQSGGPESRSRFDIERKTRHAVSKSARARRDQNAESSAAGLARETAESVTERQPSRGMRKDRGSCGVPRPVLSRRRPQASAGFFAAASVPRPTIKATSWAPEDGALSGATSICNDGERQMNVLGIALIVCGLALICAALILEFRTSEPASLQEAVIPFVPQPWVDHHPDEPSKDNES